MAEHLFSLLLYEQEEKRQGLVMKSSVTVISVGISVEETLSSSLSRPSFSRTSLGLSLQTYAFVLQISIYCGCSVETPVFAVVGELSSNSKN